MSWRVGRGYRGHPPWKKKDEDDWADDWDDWDDGDTWTGWEKEEEQNKELRQREKRWREKEEESSSDNSLRRGQRRQRWEREKEAPRSSQGLIFGPTPAEAAREGLKEGHRAAKGKGKGQAKSKPGASASSQGRPERRPAFVPEHWEGEEAWDPFRQEARGKRGREARKAWRAKDPDIQARKEQYLKEGFPANKEQPLHEGSRKWRMIKEREKEVKQEEEQLMLERKQLLEEKAAFLEEKAAWLKEQKEISPSPAREIVLTEGPGGQA